MCSGAALLICIFPDSKRCHQQLYPMIRENLNDVKKKNILQNYEYSPVLIY